MVLWQDTDWSIITESHTSEVIRKEMQRFARKCNILRSLDGWEVQQ